MYSNFYEYIAWVCYLVDKCCNINNFNIKSKKLIFFKKKIIFSLKKILQKKEAIKGALQNNKNKIFLDNLSVFLNINKKNKIKKNIL